MRRLLKARLDPTLVFFCCWFVGAAPVSADPAPGVSPAHDAMKSLDTDTDGTMDLAEARKSADLHFDAVDTDHDGTLDPKEAASVGITAAEFRKFDKDKDGTLDKREYLALVEALFKAADPDHDGTISVKELGTPKGNSLLRLLR